MKKAAISIISFTLLVLTACQTQKTSVADWNQFRGPNRDGKSTETGLLKSWPEAGPELLWTVEGLGTGYSTAIISNKTVFVTGMIDTLDYLTAFDLNGKEKWKISYGKGWRGSFPGVRISPTVENGRIYVISGQGVISCLNAADGKTIWSVDAYKKFDGEYETWGIAENLLIVDDKLIYTPGGKKTTMVALNKTTGETVWMSESIEDYTAYVSPILINRGGKKIIANITGNYLIGVDAETGHLLWKQNYTALSKLGPDEGQIINCNMPVYKEGRLFITSGYDHAAAMYSLSEDGNEIALAWQDSVLDTHHGNVIELDGYLYGSNWISNRKGNWVCLEWDTGKVMYETTWEGKGSLIYADGMLYCYEEKKGNVALVEPTPEGFNIVSSFKLEAGDGFHWAHPVIHNGILYMRHGDALCAYKVK